MSCAPILIEYQHPQRPISEDDKRAIGSQLNSEGYQDTMRAGRLGTDLEANNWSQFFN